MFCAPAGAQIPESRSAVSKANGQFIRPDLDSGHPQRYYTGGAYGYNYGIPGPVNRNYVGTGARRSFSYAPSNRVMVAPGVQQRSYSVPPARVQVPVSPSTRVMPAPQRSTNSGRRYSYAPGIGVSGQMTNSYRNSNTLPRYDRADSKALGQFSY